jgi:hypothetical protein
MSAMAGSEKTIELVPIAKATAMAASTAAETVQPDATGPERLLGDAALMVDRLGPVSHLPMRSDESETVVTDQYAFLPEIRVKGVMAMM